MTAHFSAEEIVRSHRWHAVECNNRAWELSELPARTSEEDEEMLNAAHASAFHWAKVGTELNAARAKMLLGQVYALLGRGRDALRYAQESFDYFRSNETPDWELAFAHGTLAQAACAAGERRLHQQHYAQARELGEAIADPQEKEIFINSFSRIPAP